MNLHRKQFTSLALAAIATGFWGSALAQGAYPTKTVTMVVPTAAGGTTDLSARMLAQALAPHACVVSVDVAGRGHSDWLDDPMAYTVPTYATDLAVLLAHLRQRHAAAIGSAEPYALQIDWVGTSMGGLIGMALAAQPALALRRLVLNDVGPAITWSSVQRMQTYVGQYGQYRDLDEAAAALWTLSQGFGPVLPEVWREMSDHMMRPGTDGQLTLHYDPAIGVPVRAMTPEAAATGEATLWALYDQIQAKTLLIRGQASDLLTPETATAMTQRGPRAQLDTWPGFGHAPTLTGDDQIAVVAKFLLGD